MLKTNIYLIHLVPGGVEVGLDDMAGESFSTDVDFNIRITLPFDHAAHQVVFGHEVLPRQQVDSE